MAQTQIYTRKAQVFVKAETTVDTFIAPALGDVFLADVSDSPFSIEGDNFSPNYIRPDYLQMDESPGPAKANFKFRVPLKGSGTAATIPEFGTALKACGFLNTGGANNIFTPTSIFDGTGGNPAQSYSVGMIEGPAGAGTATLYALKGAFGNVRISGDVTNGEPGWLEFEFQGAYVAPIATTILAQVYQTTIAPAFRAAALSMNFGGAVVPKGVTAFSLDIGNKITIGRDVNEVSGVYGARIVGRRSTGSFNPEMVPVGTANSNFWALWRAGTPGTLTTGLVPQGGTAGNRWTLTLARIVPRPPSMESHDGIRSLAFPFSVSSLATATESTTGAGADITLLFD